MAKTRIALCAVVATLAAPALAAAQATDEVVYYTTDAIGSVRMITDANQQVLARYDYLPFGEEFDPAAFRDPRLFAGKERDNETGLEYFGARHLSPGVGRFASVDPVMNIDAARVDPQRWNRYAYAVNNPLQYVDPDGKEPLTVLALLWAVYEGASTAYDVYTTAGTLRDSNASTGEQLAAAGGLMAGVVLPGGGYGTAGKALARHADEIADAAVVVSRTPTDRLVQHLARKDLVGAAREVTTGVQHGGQHLKEVREAARGLRERLKDINQGLSNPRLTRQRRLQLERELGIASRHLDAAEQALRGRYLQHDYYYP